MIKSIVVLSSLIMKLWDDFIFFAQEIKTPWVISLATSGFSHYVMDRSGITTKFTFSTSI